VNENEGVNRKNSIIVRSEKLMFVTVNINWVLMNEQNNFISKEINNVESSSLT